MLIELCGVNKIYNQGRANEVRALSDIDLLVVQGSMVYLKGPCGSGKSTLLAIIGCILPPTSGRAAIATRQLARLPDRFLTLHRRETIGFIFQRFNILPELTVLENITLPLLPLGIGPKERKRRAHELLERLAISHRAQFPAGQISGGELQRVAIARALINNQPIILADEPTAHLDTTLSRAFMAIMQQPQIAGKAIVIASHDQLGFEQHSLHRTINVTDGRIHLP